MGPFSRSLLTPIVPVQVAYRQWPLPVSETAMLEQKVADERDDNSDHDDAERPLQAQNIGALGGRVGLALGEGSPESGGRR